mmetsp:Transcript_15686/g.43888  ORF Transcript_15686/g.43888 Transcript_15686/m.43888 type:complete len:235 (-) Transcript_15686:237-941(-)
MAGNKIIGRSSADGGSWRGLAPFLAVVLVAGLLGGSAVRHAQAAGLQKAIPPTRVRCHSTTGDVVIAVHQEWAPFGASRYLDLVKAGFFTNSPLFRVVPNFLVQFGIASTPEVTQQWKGKGPILDDKNIGIPVKRGTVAFAGGGHDSRTTEIWIAFKDSHHLGKAPWETPFGQVVEGMENVDTWYSGYGEMKAFGGNAPDQRILYKEGVAYTKREYPKLSYILSCEIEDSGETS